MKLIQGGCQCGSVRYQCTEDPAFSLQCYCRQCQRITGTGHASQFGIPSTNVTLTGSPARFTLLADSGNTVHSYFCGRCGSPIYKDSTGKPGLWFFHAASLDHPEHFQPQVAVWVSKRQPWDDLNPTLKTMS